MNRRRSSHMSYGSRTTAHGLTGNQLKLIGIVAILIDNIGAVVIQGGILHGANRAMYEAIIATPSGHIWMVAGQVCRYCGRLAFPIFAFLVAEEFVRTRNRWEYTMRMLVFAVVSEIPFDLAVYHTPFYFHYQNMLFTLFLGLMVLMAMEHTRNTAVRGAALAAGCALSWLIQADYNVVGILLIVTMYWFRHNDIAQLVGGVVICAVESISYYCISALAYVPVVLYNGRRGALQLKYLFYVFYPVHLIVLYGIAQMALERV
ncbi:MAG: conjugal transfer protein TraX [Clostridium sp.]|nr:conjugal transfer protein TraX [Clostridium sp.]